MAETLYASFADPSLAEKAVGALLDHGARNEDIHLVAHESYRHSYPEHRGTHVSTPGTIDLERRDADFEDDDDDNPVEEAKHGLSTTTGGDAASGAAKGAGIGLGVGVIAGLVSLFVPGVGFVIGAPLAAEAIATAVGAAAATTAAGAVAGGVYGYLKDQGVPDEAAAHYHETIRGGGAMIAVRLPSGNLGRAEAEGLLAKYQASNVNAYGTPAAV